MTELFNQGLVMTQIYLIISYWTISWTCLQHWKKIASIQDVSFIYFDMTDLKIAKYVGLNIQEEDTQKQISIFLFNEVSPLTVK